MFAVQIFRSTSLQQNVITVSTVLPHHTYRPHGTNLKISPSPR